MVGFLIGLVVGFALSRVLQHWDVLGPEIKRLFGK